MDLIFDVGANIGDMTNIFKNNAKKVVAFEPNPQLSNQLRYRFNMDNVVIDPRGISDDIGIKNFNISAAHTISTLSDDWVTNSRFSDLNAWDLVLEIETITLDKAIDEYGVPDYIKIDIEGYEYEVLTSFTKLLNHTIISFEWAEEQKSKLIEIINHLHYLGYNKFYRAENDIVLFDKDIDWMNYNEFKFADDLNPNRKEKWGMVYVKV
jgi:FkbM family methyltransferase